MAESSAESGHFVSPQPFAPGLLPLCSHAGLETFFCCSVRDRHFPSAVLCPRLITPPPPTAWSISWLLRLRARSKTKLTSHASNCQLMQKGGGAAKSSHVGRTPTFHGPQGRLPPVQKRPEGKLPSPRQNERPCSLCRAAGTTRPERSRQNPPRSTRLVPLLTPGVLPRKPWSTLPAVRSSKLSAAAAPEIKVAGKAPHAS